MMFSKACEYGIRATICIAQKSLNNERIGLKGIAKAIDSPEAFTAKILQQLARDGVVTSVKGPKGGFEISESKMKQVKLIEIVTAIDGDAVFNGCGLGLSECNAAKPCPVHEQFKKVREGLKQMLSKTSLWSLATKLDDGLSFLK